MDQLRLLAKPLLITLVVAFFAFTHFTPTLTGYTQADPPAALITPPAAWTPLPPSSLPMGEDMIDSATTIPAGLSGVWYGWISVDPAVGNATFSALIALHDVNVGEIAGLVMHPSAVCGGETRLQSTGLEVINTSTDYSFGPCLDGRHVLSLNSDGDMIYEWHDPTSTRVDRGLLNRIGGFGSGIPASHLGTWSGTIAVDPRYSSVTFPVELALTGGVLGQVAGTIMLPTGNCGGEMTPSELTGVTLTIQMDFTFGGCLDGSITLTAQENGTLLYEWHDPNSDRIDRGLLTRISGAVPVACELPYFSSTTTSGLLRQNVDPWGGLPYGGIMWYLLDPPRVLPFIHYGNNRDTIANWGCAMTSSAMIVNYYAHQQGVSFSTDPELLNAYLQLNGGYVTGPPLPTPPATPTYVADSLVRYASGSNPSSPLISIETYASSRAVELRWTGSDGILYDRNGNPLETIQEFIQRTRATLNAELCALDPVILGVNRDGYQHYVLATGRTSVNDVETWRIHDPLEAAPTTLLARYGNQYNKLVRFDDDTPGRTISIMVFSPVEAILVDPTGRRTGLNPQIDLAYREISGASYIVDAIHAADGQGGLIEARRLEVADAVLGEYRLVLMGTGPGAYQVEIAATAVDGSASLLAVSGQTQTGVITQFILSYSGGPGAPLALSEVHPSVYLPMLKR